MCRPETSCTRHTLKRNTLHGTLQNGLQQTRQLLIISLASKRTTEKSPRKQHNDTGWITLRATESLSDENICAKVRVTLPVEVAVSIAFDLAARVETEGGKPVRHRCQLSPAPTSQNAVNLLRGKTKATKLALPRPPDSGSCIKTLPGMQHRYLHQHSTGVVLFRGQSAESPTGVHNGNRDGGVYQRHPRHLQLDSQHLCHLAWAERDAPQKQAIPREWCVRRPLTTRPCSMAAQTKGVRDGTSIDRGGV